MKNEVTNIEKSRTAETLRRYIETAGSQRKAAADLKVSAAVVNDINLGKWERISDQMWRLLATRLSRTDDAWTIVRTRDYEMMTKLLDDARRHANVFAVVGNAGTGKTLAMRHYSEQNRNAILLRCNEFWNRKFFLETLLRATGYDPAGLTINDMMVEAVRRLGSRKAPLIMIDEVDKLNDRVLYFFITLYNELEGHCGIVLTSTDHLTKRLQRGLEYNRRGYAEIYSRIGRRCIELYGAGPTDITQVCIANGVTDRSNIRRIIDESEGDLRRTKRLIHALRQKEADERMSAIGADEVYDDNDTPDDDNTQKANKKATSHKTRKVHETV